jgi:hypothetical protein
MLSSTDFLLIDESKDSLNVVTISLGDSLTLLLNQVSGVAKAFGSKFPLLCVIFPKTTNDTSELAVELTHISGSFLFEVLNGLLILQG